jgi:mRNA interferase MazF
VVKNAWVPEAGDIIWIDVDPQRGHEQAGHRPALVLSPGAYNGVTGLLLCVPLTTKVKGYRFEVPIAGRLGGVALADQVKSFDWRARRATKKEKASQEELAAVRARAKALLG